MTSEIPTYTLTISCPDTVGIVYAVSGFLAERGCNILDSAQFGDRTTGLFFLRVCFAASAETPGQADLETAFIETVAQRFAMNWKIHDLRRRSRVLLLVSKFGHCLNDLLYRYRTGFLDIEIPAIVSNHRDFYQLAAWHNIPFHYLPTNNNKAKQEAKILEIIESESIDLVVLARYMQILSPELCGKLVGRAINIHHSFLPSFRGAKPYHQAYARGVKLIGATAHYVSPELDEGPIIEQQVERVEHTLTPDDLVHVGRDIECVVLARAVKYHIEHRILLNGSKTVVFK